MTTVRIVFSTIDDRKTAEEIASQLVNENLAACVNIIPELTSVYKWKGAVERATEYFLLIKTTDSTLPRLLQRLQQLHPYELPEMISIAVDDGHPPYLEWVVSGSRDSG